MTARQAGRLAGWAFGLLLAAVGVLNLLLVHPVPAVAYGLVSLPYFPPVADVLKARFGFSLHPLAKLVLAIAVVVFTLGVSDLGDMID